MDQKTTKFKTEPTEVGIITQSTSYIIVVLVVISSTAARSMKQGDKMSVIGMDVGAHLWLLLCFAS